MVGVSEGTVSAQPLVSGAAREKAHRSTTRTVSLQELDSPVLPNVVRF